MKTLARRVKPALAAALAVACLLSNASAQSAHKTNSAPGKLKIAPASTQSFGWSSAPAMQQARYLFGTAMLNNKLYAVGGASGGGTAYSILEVFDPTTNSWTTAAPMPTPRYGIAAAALGGKLYAIGGYVGGAVSNKVEVYDPVSNTWAAGPNMLSAHFYVAAAVLNGKLYALGGYDINGISNKVEAFDPVTNSWSAVAPMAATRYSLGAVVLNGKLYAVGGYGSNGPLTSVEVYDPANNSWAAAPAMATKRSYVAVSVMGGKIYAVGGYTGSAVVNTVEAFDPAANAWAAAPAMATLREAPGAATINNKLYAMGGIIATGSTVTTNSMEVLATTVNAGDVVISEFRAGGPAGAQDEFIELYNNTNAPVVVDAPDGSAGWTLATAGGALVVIPNGTTIPARAHLLCANNTATTGYSLAAVASPDINYTGDIAAGAGVALFNTANPANYTLANRLDAVGSTAETDALYREGGGMTAAGGVSGGYQHSYVRDLSTGTSKDTNDNAADFIMVETSGAGLGTDGRLGAPGPENLNSPIQRNATIKPLVVDPQQPLTSAPNRVRDTTSGGTGTPTEFGTLSIRRRFKNSTGAPVTALRFRIVQFTTSQAGAAAGVADLRLLDGSGSFTVSLTGGGTDTIQRLTLEQPSDTTVGGGHNAGVLAGTITPANPLAPNASISVEFLLGVARGGSYSFFVNVEALP